MVNLNYRNWLMYKGADWYFSLFFGLALVSSSLGSKIFEFWVLILVLWSLVWVILYRKSIKPLSKFEKGAGAVLISFFLVQQFNKYVIADLQFGVSNDYSHYLLAVIPFYIHARHRIIKLSDIFKWGVVAIVVALISALGQTTIPLPDDVHYRANMLFGGHQIMFGDFVLVATMITLSAMLNNENLSQRKTVIAIVIMLTGLITVIMSGTRAAYVSLPLLLLFLVIGDNAINTQKSKVFSVSTIGAVLLIGIVLTMVFLFSPKGRNNIDRAASMAKIIVTLGTGNVNKHDIQSIDISDQSRLLMLSAGWLLFLEKPLLGHGLGSFTRSKNNFVEQRNLLHNYSQNERNRFLKFNQPHNDYLRLLCEQGLVGFFFLILFNFGAIWWLCKSLRGSTKTQYSRSYKAYSLCALMVAIAYVQFYMTEGITSRSAMFSHQLIMLAVFISQVSRLESFNSSYE